MKATKLLAYFGHHKAATTWIGNIIDQICQDSSLKYFTAANPEIFNFDIIDYVYKNKIDFINYINADITYVKQLQNFKGFHVVRDPRDIAVSAYFSHLYSHSTEIWPDLLEHRKKLANLPKNEGLILDIKFTECLPLYGYNLNLFSSMKNWDYSSPHIMEVKFEDLIHSPHEKFLEIFKFLGLFNEPEESSLISKKFLFEVIEANNFDKLSNGRNKGQENINSHYRKGIVGDWQNHFTEEHKEFFKENYNDLLVKLGYELDDKW